MLCLYIYFVELVKKNHAYGRQRISHPIWIVAPPLRRFYAFFLPLPSAVNCTDMTKEKVKKKSWKEHKENIKQYFIKYSKKSQLVVLAGFLSSAYAYAYAQDQVLFLLWIFPFSAWTTIIWNWWNIHPAAHWCPKTAAYWILCPACGGQSGD